MLGTVASYHCMQFQGKLIIVTSSVSAPPCNIDLTPFYLAPPPPNSKSVRPPYPYEQPPPLENFGKLNSPSLKYAFVQKNHFLKKQNTLFPALSKNIFEC